MYARIPPSRLDSEGQELGLTVRDRPLLERDAETGRIAALIDRAASGDGGILVVEGPAGIGKTRLLSEAEARADEAGVRVLFARASEIESEFPFGVARQLFVPALRGCTTEQREAVLAGAAGLSAKVLEEVTSSAWSLPTTDAEFATLHGLYWMLANLAELRPLLLAIDDIQWADESSLRFAAFLAPRIGELPVAIAISLRSGEPSAHQELIDRIVSDATHTVVPEPLSPQAVTALLEDAMGKRADPEFAHATHEAVVGNPFLLGLLVDELRLQGVEPDAVESDRVRGLGPRSVSRTVLMRIRGLSEAAPAVAHAVAVLGDGAEPASVAALSGKPRAEALAAADELSEAGILQTDGLSFVHPVVRNAVYEDVPPRRRAEMHAMAARVLADASGAPERVASHLLLADPAGDPEAVEWLLRAARVASGRGAPRLAADCLRRALREPPPEADRAAILAQLGAAEARAGVPEASADLARAVEIASDVAVRTTAALELGQAHAYAGEIEAAVQVSRDAADALGPDDVALRRAVEVMMMVLAETDASARRECMPVLKQASRAVDEMGERAPRALVAMVAIERALVSGTAEEAGALGELALADGTLLEDPGPEVPQPSTAAAALAIAGRHGLADRHLGSVLDGARRRGAARGFAFASVMRAWARYRAGDVLGAEADARACLDLAPGPGWDLFQAMALGVLVSILVERGELDEAESELRREIGGHGSVFSQPLFEARARLAMARGDSDRALEQLAICKTWERNWGARNGNMTSWRALTALVRAEMGHDDEARALVAEDVKLARRFGAPREIGIALRAQALVGEDDTVVEALRDAVAELDGASQLEHARALVELGAALRRLGQRREARDPLRRGLDAAHRCGAVVIAERATEELVAAGARPRRPLVTGVGSLTSRERTVAQLAADGLSNPQIAQSLFVTRKTVEAHMHSILRKLDISSRAELAPLLDTDGDGRPAMVIETAAIEARDGA